MKRLIVTALFSLGLGAGMWADATQEIYLNYGYLTNPPTVDAKIFLNQGTITFNTVTVNSNFVYPIGDSAGFNSLPFSTRDTLFYTNASSGVLAATNGFQFANITGSGLHNADTFVNHGFVTGFDFPAQVDTYATSAGTTVIPAGSVPVPAQVQVMATNIINDGTLAVGNYGVLTLAGKSVNVANGALIAGAVNTGGGGGLEFDPLDTTGQGNNINHFPGSFYVNPPGVYDLYWGTTPVGGTTLKLDELSFPQTTGVFVNTRQGFGQVGFSLPVSSNAIFSTNMFVFSIDASNTSVNIVFVNTNFYDDNGALNTNITATVGFPNITYFLGGADTNGDIEPIVQFAQTVPDVITGDLVTNAIYLTDTGGIFDVLSDSLNAASANGFSRPNAFVLTTTTPDDWPNALGSNTNFDPAIIYEPGDFSAKDVPYVVASYGAQVGRNPSDLNGNFHFRNIVNELGGGSFNGVGLAFSGDVVILPDPTNEPARIELNGTQVNLSNSRLRTEGMIIVNTTNLVGNAAGYDWGQANAAIGVTNGSLVISNLFPTNYQRLRGDVYAWEANWVNTFTNGTTNTFHYHVMVVDQNLGGNFRSVVRDLHLTGTNSITLQDSLYVINQSFFATTNLIINSNEVFNQNAGSLTMANYPKLKSLLVNTNGSLTVDNLLDVGFDSTKTPTTPKNRKYGVYGVTNFGAVFANAPLIQSQFFENDGSIFAVSNGSIIIEASSLGLGQALTNGSNLLQADNNITLSADSIEITDSTIFAGGVLPTNLGGLTLQTTAAGQITDFTAGDPSTNTYFTNMWQVTDGFSLPVKPATGDLFGTEITTIATNFTVALHTWSAIDFGPTSQGFVNNMVIGHLKLSRQSPGAQLHFTGVTPGGHYGMYVDFLELDQNSLSYSNYQSGLVIDPNLTIYFAAANVDPTKLESAFTNRLVWVPTFFGLNSTVTVPWTNCAGMTNYCQMNANLAFSPTFGFFTNDVTGLLIPNAFNQPFVLNDPNGDCSNNAINFSSCGGNLGAFKDFTIMAPGTTNIVNMDISSVGSGTITPNVTKNDVALGKSYTLTANPAKGWDFAGWSTVGLSADVNGRSPVLKFKLQNSVMLTASFVPKTFTLVEGAYNGLFLSSNALPTAATSGYFTLSVNAEGACSGKLLLGATPYAFSSQFSTNGFAIVVAKHGNQTLGATLQLDMTGQSGQVTGYVGNPSVPLLGNVAPTWTAKNASPFAGAYTMILTNGGSNSVPIGNSYGSLTVSKLGMLAVAGELADGNAFTQSAPISKDGLWPFYAYVSKGEDCVLGWVDFVTQSVNRATISPTNIYWSKTASAKDPYYPGGFTAVFDLVGSSYKNPGKGGPVLTLVDPVVILSGGDMAKSSTNLLASKNNLMYYSTNLTLNINPAAGTFSGRYQDDTGGLTIKLKGVVLQSQDSAFGFSLGTSQESGAVLLESQ